MPSLTRYLAVASTIAVVVLALLVVTVFVVDQAVVWAASITFNITTAAQDTYIQTVLIPNANTELCARYGLGPSCTGAQLLAAVPTACVPAAANLVTKSNLVYRNCTPFTLDTAGEAAFAADLFAQDLVARVAADKAKDLATFCTVWKAMTLAQKNATLAAMTPSQAAGMEACQ